VSLDAVAAVRRLFTGDAPPPRMRCKITGEAIKSHPCSGGQPAYPTEHARSPERPGRGAVWLARLNGVQEVAGSNPVAPTLQTACRKATSGRPFFTSGRPPEEAQTVVGEHFRQLATTTALRTASRPLARSSPSTVCQIDRRTCRNGWPRRFAALASAPSLFLQVRGRCARHWPGP
jgi:hypothetical protein